jgi:hypothetical protein
VSTLNVDKVDPSTGTALEIGSSGDTITVPSGATLTTTSATLNLPTTITATTEVKTNKISPATGTAFALGDSGDTFTVPSGATIVNSGTATGFGITQTSFLPTAAPILVNGDMAVAQRATSATGIASTGYHTVDRMNMQINSLGTWTFIQEALTSGAAFEAGFANAFRMDCTTADASPSASDYLQFKCVLEGQDVQMFKKGTSAAETYTLAFWVKSNKTGTAQVNIVDDNSRMCSATYTISSADTWEHKVLNFAADTTGTIDNDNSSGYNIVWWLDAGSNFTSGTVPTAWEARATADRGVENLSLADSTSNDWAITGLQLEVGTYTSADLPPFRFESYGDNLIRCMRYYENNYKDGEYPGDSGITDAGSFSGFLYSTDFLSSIYGFKVRKRANPTMTFYDRNGTAAKWYAGVYQVSEAIEDVVSSINQPQGFAATCSGVVANTNESHGFWTADAEL